MIRYVLIILALPIAALADNPFAIVDSDFADAFLGKWFESRPTYSTSIPDNLMDIELPEDFSLIGSQVGEREFIVVYKSTAKTDEVFLKVVDAMEEDGWTNLSDFSLVSQRVYRTHAMPTIAAFCRNEPAGLLAIAIEERPQKTFLSFSGYRNPQVPGPLGIGCSLVAPTIYPFSDVLRDYLPILILPDDAQKHGDSRTESGDEVRARIILSTTLSREDLANHFAEQIQKQDWVLDSNWIGKHTAGSLWSIESADAGTLIGELAVSGSTGDDFRVRFAIWPAVGRDVAARAREAHLPHQSN